MVCPACGLETAANSSQCHHCGSVLPSAGIVDRSSSDGVDTVDTNSSQRRAVFEVTSSLPEPQPLTHEVGRQVSHQLREPVTRPVAAAASEQTAVLPSLSTSSSVHVSVEEEQNQLQQRAPRWPFWVSTALAFVLAVTLAIGTIYSKQQIADRNTTIGLQADKIGQLSKANSDFQAQVNQLVSERDGLVSLRDQLQSERDGLIKERDDLTAQRDDLSKALADLKTERDGLASERDSLKKQVSDLQATVGDKDRQISQAQSDASRQQSRAQSAEAVGAILAKVVVLDDQIHDQFGNLLADINDMEQALQYRDSVGYYNAQARANQTMNTIGGLFAQRKALLDQLQ